MFHKVLYVWAKSQIYEIEQMKDHSYQRYFIGGSFEGGEIKKSVKRWESTRKTTITLFSPNFLHVFIQTDQPPSKSPFDCIFNNKSQNFRKNILFFMKLSTPDAIRNDKFYPLLARSDYKKITLVSALYFHIGYYFLMLVKL